MKNNKQTNNRRASVPRNLSSIPLPTLLSALLLLIGIGSVHAGSATWSAAPTNNKWNSAANWVPQTVPKKPTDTATFESSSITNLQLPSSANINGIKFGTGAGAYSFTETGLLVLSGAGITNNSGVVQNFILALKGNDAGIIDFTGNATAGTSTTFAVKPGLVGTNAYQTYIEFDNFSTAGSASFILEGAPNSTMNSGGEVWFYDNSSADNASFTINGSKYYPYGSGGDLYYGSTSSTPFSGNIVINGGAVSNAYGGAAYFDVMSILSLTGTITANGGSATGARPGELDLYSASATIDGTITINGGGLAYIEPTALTLNGTLTINGGSSNGAAGGDLTLSASQVNAGSGTVTVNGGSVNGAYGGTMYCEDVDAGVTSYTVNGGNGSRSHAGQLFFDDTHGVTGKLVANGGINHGPGGFIYVDSSKMGTVGGVVTYGNGTVDLSSWDIDPQPLGSIEGTGIIKGDNIVVGSNNLDTTFSGTLSIASLTKEGDGTLTLASGNGYLGGLTVNAGTVLITNTLGSATGSGPVTVNSGSFGGTGIATGPATIGLDSGNEAILSPGNSDTGTLTIKKTLTFDATGTYACELNSDSATADKVVAKGVTINSGALFSGSDLGATVLPAGTVFTVIDNTAATAISGTFSNLSDGSITTIGSNNYQVSYSGGDGNDLTLTVVP